MPRLTFRTIEAEPLAASRSCFEVCDATVDSDDQIVGAQAGLGGRAASVDRANDTPPALSASPSCAPSSPWMDVRGGGDFGFGSVLR